MFLFFALIIIIITTITSSSLNNPPSCPCFFSFLPSRNAGFGHRFLELATGHMLADDLNCTYVAQRFTFAQLGTHGSYAALAALLRLNRGELFVDRVQPPLVEKASSLTHPFTKDVRDKVAKRDCARNALFVMSGQSCFGPRGRYWCLVMPNVAPRGALKHLVPRWPLAARATAPGPPWLDADDCQIVTHLRFGDVVLLNRTRLFKNVFAYTTATWPRCSTYRFLGAATRSTDLQLPRKAPPPQFAFLPAVCKQFNVSCEFHHELSIVDSFVAMVRATVLFTTGSSFAQVAALYRTGPTLHVDGKDVDVCPRCNSRPDYVFFDRNGNRQTT
jgi:hypothetical protein